MVPKACDSCQAGCTGWHLWHLWALGGSSLCKLCCVGISFPGPWLAWAQAGSNSISIFISILVFVSIFILLAPTRARSRCQVVVGLCQQLLQGPACANCVLSLSPCPLMSQ